MRHKMARYGLVMGINTWTEKQNPKEQVKHVSQAGRK